MPLIGGDSLYRLTDYLDKQAVREKEKRNETFLKVLPTYLEKQLSGITDEKTLFSTIPKLSAKMYAFGPQVGQAANQILGNLANSKYKEISLGKEESQRQAEIGAVKDVYSKFDLGGKTVDELTATLEGKYGENVTAGMVESVLKTSVSQRTGVVTGEDGQTWYNSYDFNPVTGKEVPGIRYQVKKDETGQRYLDDPKTEENENLPIPLEVMKSIAAQLDAKQKMEDELKLYGQKINLTTEKQKDALKEKMRGKQYKDIVTGDPIFGDTDDEGRPYLYKIKETPTQTMGKLILDKKGEPYFGMTKEKEIVTDYTNVEDLAQGLPGEQKIDKMNASEIRLETSKANLYAQNIGQAMIAAGDVAEKDIRDSDTGYFSVEKLIEVAEDYPEKYGDVKAKIIELNLSGANTLTGRQQSSQLITPERYQSGMK